LIFRGKYQSFKRIKQMMKKMLGMKKKFMKDQLSAQKGQSSSLFLK